MTPGAYRRKGEGLTIHYGLANGPFGQALVGATDKGICWLSFFGDAGLAAQIEEMKGDWPAAEFVEDDDFVAPLASQAFSCVMGRPLDTPIGLYVQGTNFQLKVWEALLRIPYGACITYGIWLVRSDRQKRRALSAQR